VSREGTLVAAPSRAGTALRYRYVPDYNVDPYDFFAKITG
jgi:hypothetical protein